jgi:hypothetical protein
VPTYHEVMSTDLSVLGTSAERWTEAADRYRQVAQEYETRVHGISLGRTWRGLSADAANARFGITLAEIRGAARQAGAVAAVLRDAQTQLTGVRNRVRAVRDAAVEDGMRVSEQGVVAFDTSRLTPGERLAHAHDPDYERTMRARADAWAERLARALLAVAHADDGVRIALAHAVRDTDMFDGTFDGFNRSPAELPFPSLLEAGKAAAMPGDRKAVPGWWHSLDPVTRGILLRERGEELRAAGVMDPRFVWSVPDEGSGDFNSEKVTPRDNAIHAQALAIAAAGDFIGQVGASRNMMHYLGGTGEPLTLDVDRMLRDDAGLRNRIQEGHLRENQEEWRRKALEEFHRAGGDRTVVIPVESEAKHESLQSLEWFRAVGSHAQNVSGVVTVTPDEGGNPKVSLDYQVNIWDRYNWDEGKSTQFVDGKITIRDEDMGRLHKVGIAREFDMYGGSSALTYDLGSSGPPDVSPPGGDGNEGTRGDISRGEEENR